ncbi:MAG: hypothetical protein JRI68_13805, partial [Deltaproteobacteria bacterium]|nr:hypothetical protein [Deltaproteobacteria bacterium]
DSDVEAAKGMHTAAKQFYDKARYDRALETWVDAYNFDCNAHMLLINIGNPYEKLGETAKAIETFEIYIARVGDKADEKTVEKVANLKELLQRQQEPDPPPPPPPDPNGDKPQPNGDPNGGTIDTTGGPGALPWIVVGVGGAAAVVGAVLLGVGSSKVNDAESKCPSHDECDNEDARALGNEGLTLQRAGGGVFAVGLLAIGGGLVWYFLGSKDSASQAFATPSLDVGVTVSPAYSGLSLTGSF